MDGEKNEWQAPPIPEKIAPAEQPEMSELATLGNIFIEPGRTFEDLRKKPRFVFAALIIVILSTAFTFSLSAKLGDESVRRFMLEQMDKNPRADSMTNEQKNSAVELQVTIQKYARFAVPVFVVLFLVIGGLLYWGGAKAFGGNGGILHGISVWTYSSFPISVVMTVCNFLILFLKDADDIDFGASQRGLVHANFSFLVDGKAMPVLATLLSVFDVFAIWGWILASIGLQKTNKISSASAWTITMLISGFFILLRIVMALFTGNQS